MSVNFRNKNIINNTNFGACCTSKNSKICNEKKDFSNNLKPLLSTEFAIKYFTKTNNIITFGSKKSNIESDRDKIFKKREKEFKALRKKRIQRREELESLNKLRGDSSFKNYELYCFEDLDDNQYKRLKDIMFIKNLGENQVSKCYFKEILDLPDEQYKMFRQLIDIKGRKEQFCSYSVLSILPEVKPEEFHRIRELAYIKGRENKQFNLYEVCSLAKGSEEQFKKIKKLVYIPELQKRQLDISDIKEMAHKLNEHDFKNLIMLLSLKHPHTEPYSISDVTGILSDDKMCERYKKLLDIKGRGDNQLNKYTISSFSKKLTDKKFKIFEKLLYIKDFGDNQLTEYEIKELFKLKPDKFNETISLLNDKDLHITKDDFCKLSKCKEIKTITKLIKQHTNIKSSKIIELFDDISNEKIEFIKPVLQKSEIYNIQRDGTEITVTEKESNNQLIMINKSKKDFMNQFIYTSPGKDGAYDYIYIIKLSTGTYISRGTSSSKETEDIYFNAKRRPYEKLYNIPKNQNFTEMFEFFKKGNFKTKKVFEIANEDSIGHAIFHFKNGSNTVEDVNGTIVSQLDKSLKSKDSNRIVYHYPDGRTVVEDWDLGLSTSLEPNESEDGMRIRKISGDKIIDLTSKIENGNITITNNLTGNSFSIGLKEFIKRDNTYEQGRYRTISSGSREYEITELMKKLSPTTILNLIKFKNTKNKASFPFLVDAKECYQNGTTITLSKSPHTVSHEALHGISEILNLPENNELSSIHSVEARLNKGLKRVISRYATDGIWYDKTRGLDELISIIGTANEYGTELSERTEMTRLAYPKTIKAIDETLMEYYTNTISELVDNKK